jgi:VCBS repeat-containing protein
MRRLADPGISGFDVTDVLQPPAADTPPTPQIDLSTETPPADITSESVQIDGSNAGVSSLWDETAPKDAAGPGAASGGVPFEVAVGSIQDVDDGSWSHALANGDSFRFDTDQNEDGQPGADSGASPAPEGTQYPADGFASHFASISDGADSPMAVRDNSWSAESSNQDSSNQGNVRVANADFTGTADSFVLGANADTHTPPSFGSAGAHNAPSVPQSDGPILAWVGDTGAGTSGGAGSGVGSGGAAVHTTAAAPSGLVINVVYDSSVANAPAGFKAAVAQVVSFYESHFSDPVTVTIDVGYGEIAGQSMSANALGESETYLTSVSYASLRSALVNNANAIGDAAAVASLPATSPVSGQYWMSTAEAKALGVTGASSSVDGYVGFSNAVNFAYNDANGVAAGQYDFFGVVAHEFSEVMGRQMMDGESFVGSAGYEPLDLFHYSAAGVRDFSGTTTGYASADGGKTALDYFNTNPGGDFGDWAASAGYDSFDAFSYSGVVNPVTASDLKLMNLLGWDPSATTVQPTPVVSIGLAHDTSISSSDDITSNDALTGTADANAVVILTSGTKTIGSTTANASGVWSFTPVGLADGSETIVASDTNSAGETSSASLTFTLDTTAPTVASDTVSGGGINGGAGMLTGGKTVVFTLTMSEAVAVSHGAPLLTLNDGGVATYDSAHSTAKTLVFDYTVGTGQYASALAVTGVDLNGASVTDIAGNTANLTGAVTTFSKLVVDGTIPVATADHAHDVLNGSVSVSHAQAATSGVLADDTDSDPADVLSVNAVNGSSANVGHAVTGAFGALTLNADGSYSFTNTNASAVAAAGGVAEDIFNYTVNNGHGGTAASTLTVLITSPSETYLTGAHGSTIKGGAGSYVLDGSAGSMNVTAGSGAQWLVGGAGDTLTGGSSADTFMFAPSFGKETVSNFNAAQDVIDLPQSLFENFAAVHADMHASGANTVIAFDAADAITLSNIAVQNLHAQNFHFVV